MSTATIRVQFGESAGGAETYAVVELDETLNLDFEAKPKTEFAPGETAYFLVHLAPGWVLARILQTSGQVTAAGTVTLARQQKGVVFSPLQAAIDLTYYPAGPVAAVWQDNQLALAAPVGRSLAAVQQPPSIMAKADLSYRAAFFRFRYDPNPAVIIPEEEGLSVEILIIAQYQEAAP